MWQSFVCAMTAAGVLQALDPFRSGKLVLYQVKFSTGWHGFEIIPFAFLGILGGIYGGLFIKANMRVAQWKKSTTWLPGPLSQVVIVAFLTALINYPNFYMRAQTSELVSSLFTDCSLVLDDPFALCKTGAASASTIVLLLLPLSLAFSSLPSHSACRSQRASSSLPWRSAHYPVVRWASSWRFGSIIIRTSSPLAHATQMCLVSHRACMLSSGPRRH